MLQGEIHDEIVVLNTYAADDKAATITRQKLQETPKEAAVIPAAGDHSALSVHGGPNGQNAETSGPRKLLIKQALLSHTGCLP